MLWPHLLLLTILLVSGIEAQNCNPVAEYGNAAWPSTPRNTYAIGVCKGGWGGTPLRQCRADGTWASSITNHCTRLRCAATTEGNATWAQTEAGGPRVGSCLPGFGGYVSRPCKLDGTWGPIVGTCAKCYAEFYARVQWGDAPAQSYFYGTCEAGYYGSPYRWCEPGGIWQTYIWNTCQRGNCTGSTSENAVWPTTNTFDYAIGQCSPGFVGNPVRQCLGNFSFGPVISNPCIPEISCPSENYARATWPSVTSGNNAQGQCDNGWRGNPFRACTSDGWSTLVMNHCERITCSSTLLENANFPTTNSFDTASGTCQAGFSGNPSRLCQADGTYGPVISNPCVPLTTCTSGSFDNAVWPSVTAGTNAPGVCQSGWEGEPTRLCGANGWEEVVNPCERTTCASTTAFNATFPSANSHETSTGTCLPGFTGTPTRTCLPSGEFGPVNNPCSVVNQQCAAEVYARASWPPTDLNGYAVGSCEVGWEGNPMRLCTSNVVEDRGVWSTNVLQHCTRKTCAGGLYLGVNWPTVNPGTNARGTCPPGTSPTNGPPYRFCKNNAVWESTIRSSCA